MASIPQYQIPNYASYLTDTSGNEFLAQSIYNNFQNKAKLDREQDHQLREKYREFNPADLKKDENTDFAIKGISEIEDYMARAYTFEMDDKGNFTKKPKGLSFKPNYSDRENAFISKKINEFGKEFIKRKAGEELVRNETEEYKKNQDKYDPEYFNLYMKDYIESNSIPEAGTFLSISPNTKLEAHFSDKKLDLRSDIEKKSKTPEYVGDIIKYTNQSLSPDKQKIVYLSEIYSNQSLQKGIVDRFMKDEKLTPREKIDIIAGQIIGDKSGNKELEDQAYAIASSAAYDYTYKRKFSPELIDAGTFYGDKYLGLPSMIGKGDTWEEANTSLHNARIKEGWDTKKEATKKAEEESKKTANLNEIQQTFGGVKYYKYVDLSNVEPVNTTLKGFKLRSGAKRYLEKIDPNTGKVTPYEVGGKKGQAVRISNPPEMKKEIDYRIAGFDKEADIIRLVKIEPTNLEKDESEFFTIPLKGNEELLKEPVKKLGVSEDYLKTKTTGKYNLQGYGEFTREELKSAGWTDKQIDALK